jgi:multiple sugar transport system substrate-binding protein
MRKLSALGSALLVAGLLSTGAAGVENLVLLSTQLRPIEEAQKMRNVILKDFPE